MEGQSRNGGSSDLQWAPCPAGEIGRLSNRLQQRKQRREFLRTASVLGGLAAIGGGMWLWWRTVSPHEYHFAGISCTEVREIVVSQQLAQVSRERLAQLREHVTQCPNCDRLRGSMKTNM